MAAAHVVGRFTLCIVVALCLGLIFFIFVVWALHPFEGILEGYRHVSRPEYYVALVMSVSISVATLWRLLRGSSIRDELKRAAGSISSGEG